MRSPGALLTWLGGFVLNVIAHQQCARSEHHVLANDLPLCHDNSQHHVDSFQHPIWSNKPFCVSGTGKEYCSHTKSNLRKHRGLSIISTPSAAEAISSSFLHARNARYISDDYLEVHAISGKGFGLITTQFIKRGQTILLDSARIIASAQFPAQVSHMEGASLFQGAVSHLLPQDRDAILDLDKSLGGTDIEDIMKTNAFACQLNDGTQGDGYMCLFPSVARINHACRPNAHTRFIPKTLLMEVKAVRDIDAGEEISISYGKVDLEYEQRQKLYKEGWNFTCTCDMCMASKYKIAGSDQRRRRFGKLREKIESVTPETYDAHQIVAWEKEILELSEKEGLDVLLAQDFERMAYMHAGFGLIQDAKRWANMARESLLDWTIVEGGPDNELRRVEDLLAELGA